MATTQSRIFQNKNSAIEYLNSLPLNGGYDGQHYIARYWVRGEGSDIASVEGILHSTNGVKNIEVKDASGGGGSSSAGTQKGNYVIKKRFPIFFTDKYHYFYDGKGIQFELPIIYPGEMAQIVFPSELVPYLWDKDDSENSIIKNAFKGRERVKTDGGRSNLRFCFGESYRDTYDGYTEKIFEINFIYGEDVGESYNILNIYNNSENSNFWLQKNTDFPNATITMQNGYGTQTVKYSYLNKMYNEIRVLSKSEGIGLIGGSFDKDALDGGAILTDLSTTTMLGMSYKLKHETSVGSEPVKAIIIDLRHKINVEANKKVTAATTSPGFMIENGKVRCYRKSELSDFLYKPRFFKFSPNARADNCTRELYKYFKDRRFTYDAGTYIERHLGRENNNITLYYKIRNIINCGRGKEMVLANNVFLWNLCGERNKRIVREHGLLFYKGTMQRHPYYFPSSENQRVQRQYTVTVKFESVSNGKYVFSVDMPETPVELEITKIGVKFVGTDGNLHEGYVIPDDGRLQNGPITGGSIVCSNLVVKNNALSVRPESSKELYMSNNNVFAGTMESTFVTFKFDARGLQPYERIAFKCDADQTKLRGYSKWKPLSLRDNWYAKGRPGDVEYRHLPDRFEKRHLNACMYIKKFKGVKSEYPEIFYTR